MTTDNGDRTVSVPGRPGDPGYSQYLDAQIARGRAEADAQGTGIPAFAAPAVAEPTASDREIAELMGVTPEHVRQQRIAKANGAAVPSLAEQYAAAPPPPPTPAAFAGATALPTPQAELDRLTAERAAAERVADAERQLADAQAAVAAANSWTADAAADPTYAPGATVPVLPAEPGTGDSEPWPYQHAVYEGVTLEVIEPSSAAAVAVALASASGNGELSTRTISKFLTTYLSPASYGVMLDHLLEPDTRWSHSGVIQAVINSSSDIQDEVSRIAAGQQGGQR